uniref:Conserved Oligomeric Golgi complex subunit 6 C-terminal domain-containing protein n=1 Tax=Eptatretus burgeri TaxID=7764 RepID=A0A8C4R155_EPTBU
MGIMTAIDKSIQCIWDLNLRSRNHEPCAQVEMPSSSVHNRPIQPTKVNAKQATILNFLCYRGFLKFGLITTIGSTFIIGVLLLCIGRRMLAVQAEVAAAFLAKFQLQPKEEQALREPVTQEFFDALDRVKAIHDDVKILLRSNQQTAGLEIMEQMALHEEAAYERLYRWAQNDCRGLTRDSCDVSPLLIRALACLQPRPVLFKYVIDEFGAARRSAVVRCFIEALTRGGASGTPRPIEMHCHDPLRRRPLGPSEPMQWLLTCGYLPMLYPFKC